MTAASDSLISLYQQMAELTKPECAKCKLPHSCCSIEYCLAAEQFALERYGVDITETRVNEDLRREGVFPIAAISGSLQTKTCADFHLAPTGCNVEPHYRILCTLHTCDIMTYGYKPGDEEWTKRYYQLRESINQEEMRLLYEEPTQQILNNDKSALTAKQQALVDKVAEQLKGEPWFQGVCLDNLPSDAQIDKDGEQAYIDLLSIDTAYWDGPTNLIF